MDSAGQYRKLKIAEIRREVPGFCTLVFRNADGIPYRSGQYLTLVTFRNGEEVRRSYSIVSSPALHEPLAIGVKRVENGFFSRKLVDESKPGDIVLSSGVGGFFVLPEKLPPGSTLFFFAAGSGISPVLSLIKTALHSKPGVRVVLVYSNASPGKAAYLQILQALRDDYPATFQVELLFSNAADLSGARLHRDLMLAFLRQYGGLENSNALFFICGPESYMRMCIYTLREHGVPEAQIRKENFIIHTVPKRDAAPPDTSLHSVTIRKGSQEFSIDVQYPDSILRSAKRAGLVMPYSCEAGRCGNCVARCTSGTVWHSYNEVLTDRELNEGLVLTCTGHPVGGDVVLEVQEFT
ncbi:MAG TPA: iron-sulfur cluster-binding domain-containing protein [Flavisolibacter sp.]